MNGSIVNYPENTMEYKDMHFEKLASQAIQIEFPNSINAIRPVDRLDASSAGSLGHTVRSL